MKSTTGKITNAKLSDKNFYLYLKQGKKKKAHNVSNDYTKKQKITNHDHN